MSVKREGVAVEFGALQGVHATRRHFSRPKVVRPILGDTMATTSITFFKSLTPPIALLAAHVVSKRFLLLFLCSVAIRS